jgi:hypothetical protein
VVQAVAVLVAGLVVPAAEAVLAEEAVEVAEGAAAVEEAEAVAEEIRTGAALSTDNSPTSEIVGARSSLPIQAQPSSHWRIPH